MNHDIISIDSSGNITASNNLFESKALNLCKLDTNQLKFTPDGLDIRSIAFNENFEIPYTALDSYISEQLLLRGLKVKEVSSLNSVDKPDINDIKIVLEK